jgi:hypothetical protein
MSPARQLALPACEPEPPRLRARRDLSAAAFERALGRIGVWISAGCTCFDDAGRRYDAIIRHDPPLRIARRATLAHIRRQLQERS